MVERMNVLEMRPGQFYNPLEFTATPELNQQYCYGEEDFHSRYIRGENSNPPLLHPGLFLNMTNSSRAPGRYLPEGVAGLHAGDHTEFLAPAYVGQRFRITFQNKDNFERRGRFYRITETVMYDEKNTPVLRRTSTSTIVTKKLSAAKKAREEGRKPAAESSAGAPPSGALICGPAKRLTYERMLMFSGGPLANVPDWPNVNIHTDKAFANKNGIPDLCASGTQYLGYLTSILIDHFGHDWLTTGRLDSKIVKYVLLGDVITSKCVITSKQPTKGDTTTLSLDVWTENQNGERTLTGGGSVRIRDG